MAGRGKIQIFSGRSATSYAKKVLKDLKNLNEYTKRFVELAGQTKVKIFSDGEIEVEILNSVRRKDVYIFQNCASRNEFNLSTHENKIELYHLIDALKRAHVESITVFEPYISTSRSDRATGRGSVGLWIHLKTMINLGVNHIITFQLHSEKSSSLVSPKEAFFDNIPIQFLLKKHILKNYIKTKKYFKEIVPENWAICSVDIGGESLARLFANTFNCQLIVGYKRRDYSTINKVKEVSILTDKPIENKTVWIVDDMIDTGGSIYELVKTLKKYKVKTINIAIIHPVLSFKGVERLKSLHQEGLLNRVIATDTLWISDSLKKELPFLDIVSTTNLAANIVYKTNIGESLSDYFEPLNPYHCLED